MDDNSQGSQPIIVNVNGEAKANPAYVNLLAREIDALDNSVMELRTLLAKNAKLLEHEGLRRETDMLMGWMIQSADGLRTTRHLFEAGPKWLNDIHARVALAKEELSRLEDEGGNLGPKSSDEAKNLNQVFDGVQKILGNMGHLFAPPEDVTRPVNGQSEKDMQLLC